MNQRFIYSDKADLYLKGKLSGNERIDFEEKMQKDPLLQSEMKLQQEVYQALGEARKTGLKARLNQIPIDQSPWFAGTTFKVATIVSALVMTSVVTYMTLTSSETSVPYEVDLTKADQLVSPAPRLKVPEPVSSASTEVSSMQEVIQEPEENTFTASNQPKAKKAPEIPAIQRPNVTADFSEDAVQLDYSDFEVPQKQALQANASTESDVTVEQVIDAVYPFHYQFYNDKLFLHGDFQDTPYKIIALNTESGRKLFLEYTGRYYRIEEQEAISPLVSITDSSLIQELRRLDISE